MKIDPGMHIGLHLVFFGKTGVTQVGQDHAATGVLLALGTNNQLHRPENAAEHQTRATLTYTGQASEHHRSDRSLLVELGNFHRKAPTPVRLV
jgi:hypothetical protein